MDERIGCIERRVTQYNFKRNCAVVAMTRNDTCQVSIGSVVVVKLASLIYQVKLNCYQVRAGPLLETSRLMNSLTVWLNSASSTLSTMRERG